MKPPLSDHLAQPGPGGIVKAGLPCIMMKKHGIDHFDCQMSDLGSTSDSTVVDTRILSMPMRLVS